MLAASHLLLFARFALVTIAHTSSSVAYHKQERFNSVNPAQKALLNFVSSASLQARFNSATM